jgi:hypothetical protein
MGRAMPVAPDMILPKPQSSQSDQVYAACMRRKETEEDGEGEPAWLRSMLDILGYRDSNLMYAQQEGGGCSTGDAPNGLDRRKFGDSPKRFQIYGWITALDKNRWDVRRGSIWDIGAETRVLLGKFGRLSSMLSSVNAAKCTVL